jgi:pyruvate,water dikinase
VDRVIPSDVVLPAHRVERTTPVGGKAAALAALTRAELPVPPWFVVMPAAFAQSVAGEVSGRLARAASADEAQSLISQVVIAPTVAAQIEALLDGVGGSDPVFAVRSSALDEDSARFSFAGQLDSFLFVPRSEVLQAIVKVWRSGFSERILRYRREAGLGPLAGVPAVIVQRMIDGDVSGVAFSADPVSGRRGVTVVAAVPGLGSALVSGEAAADTWRVDRSDAIVERVIEHKRVMHRADRAGAEGVSSVAVPEAIATQPALRDADIVRAAALARRAQAHFGRPQDIEWTLAGRDLYLLQSRPITTLAGKADPDGVRALWDNSNIIESYSGVTTPLTFSFARHAYEHVYREFCRLIRVPEPVIESHAAMFSCMLGLIEGRVYYNLYNWYRLVAVLPGYASNRRFMEQMMGVRESLPAELASAQQHLRAVDRVRDLMRLAHTLVAFAGSLITIDRRVARFYQRLQDTLGTGRPDFSALRPDELMAYYRNLESRLLTHWDAPIVNDFATMIFHGLLRKLCTKWAGDPDGTLSNDLISGDEGMISEEPARRVREMAALLAKDAELTRVLCEEPVPAIRARVRTHAQLHAALTAYLDKFGERCMEELKLESATLHDDPTPLLRAIGQYARNLAQQSAPARSSHEATIRQKAEQRMQWALARHPLRRAVFAWVLRAARRRVRARENLRFERTRVFGRARQLFVEMGRRLAALDVLSDPRDVFYLEIDEALAFFEARSTTVDLGGLAAVRKAEFEGYRSRPAPADRFETFGIVYRGNSFGQTQTQVAVSGETLRGLGCCPGVVRGPVRVVTDPRNANVRPGEIVVAERTDPGWVMIFPSAAGLLVERGSLLSHSAIVARELGLPTVVSLAGLTGWLHDGDWVEMDGASGRVTRIAAETEEAAHAA